LPDPRAARVFSGMHATIPTEPIAVDVDLHEPLLTADQVAELLAVPRSSVYEYARRLHRPLPSISVGRHRRFYRSDVAAWLAGQRGAGS
jgi:excisionase family DNA binding protein